MKDLSKQKWEFSNGEVKAIKWLEDNNFDIVLNKQNLSKTQFMVSKNGVSDKFELPQCMDYDIDSYMKLFARQFELTVKLRG